jgi:hypothetical protein
MTNTSSILACIEDGKTTLLPFRSFHFVFDNRNELLKLCLASPLSCYCVHHCMRMPAFQGDMRKEETVKEANEVRKFDCLWMCMKAWSHPHNISVLLLAYSGPTNAMFGEARHGECMALFGKAMQHPDSEHVYHPLF